MLHAGVQRGRVALDRTLHHRVHSIYQQFELFTMIPRKRYLDNLALGSQIASIEGAIVECGVWRGGMIAGLARTKEPFPLK